MYLSGFDGGNISTGLAWQQTLPNQWNCTRMILCHIQNENSICSHGLILQWLAYPAGPCIPDPLQYRDPYIVVLTFYWLMILSHSLLLSCGSWVMVSLPPPELPFPSWGWFSTVAELAVLIFSLSCPFCQIFWWPTDSAFSVSTISGTLFFPCFSNIPLDLISWSLSSPKP